MRFKNIDPQGDIQASALGGRLVAAGEVVETFGDVAAAMADQPDTWESRISPYVNVEPEGEVA